MIAYFHSSEPGASLEAMNSRAEVDADRARHQRRSDTVIVENAAGGGQRGLAMLQCRRYSQGRRALPCRR
jgi:hypothetical protein